MIESVWKINYTLYKCTVINVQLDFMDFEFRMWNEKWRKVIQYYIYRCCENGNHGQLGDY